MSEIIFPNYEHSILNTINSILKYYKVDTKYNGLPELDEKLKHKYKNIVLVLLDGMGEHVLKNISSDGFFVNNEITKVTSVCPSTTTAAITTYYSGKPPIETGWIAMSQYFKEYGRALEMLRRVDSYTHEPIKNASKDVFDLIKYVPIYDQIEKASPNVKAYEINPGFCDSRSKRNLNADSLDVMCDYIKSICYNQDQNFIFAYSDKPDTILHKYGCNSNEAKEFVLDAQKHIEKLCADLKESNTLIIVTADHGHKDIEKVYNIVDMDEIQDCIYMPPSLESRAVTFWVKEDKKEKFVQYFENNLKDEFMLFTREEFLAKNFLGYGEKHKKIDDFLGNYIAVSIDGAILKLGTNISKPKADKKSTHCGFTKNEMEVPVIVIG
ncbi:MAG: alkaline phosphatase family protein [Clostridia bacterium]|nr:alkaline phosphatase family protein [Clostridia bacterium]